MRPRPKPERLTRASRATAIENLGIIARDARMPALGPRWSGVALQMAEEFAELCQLHPWLRGTK